MVQITHHNKYVKIDLSYFANAGVDITDKIIYLMRDQAVLVSLENKVDRVRVELANGMELFLDMAGANGLPAKIINVTPESNEELAEELAKLKNL